MRDRKLLSMKPYQLLLEDCHNNKDAKLCPACALAEDILKKTSHEQDRYYCNCCFLRNACSGYEACSFQGKEDYEFIFEQECGLTAD